MRLALPWTISRTGRSELFVLTLSGRKAPEFIRGECVNFNKQTGGRERGPKGETGMVFKIKNRHNQKVIYEVDVHDPDGLPLTKIAGAAAAKAICYCGSFRFADLPGVDLSGKSISGVDFYGANLAYSDLSGCDLHGVNFECADLQFADISGASLCSTDFHGAHMEGVDFSSFRKCLWETLFEYESEVDNLVSVIKAGAIDGGFFEGSCCCLIGTIAKGMGTTYQALEGDPRCPSEEWASMIKPGDTPGYDSGGGFAATMLIRWIDEWRSVKDGYEGCVCAASGNTPVEISRST